MLTVLISSYISLVAAALSVSGDYGWAIFFFGNFLSGLAWLIVHAKD